MCLVRAVGFSFLSVSPASLPSRAAAAFPSRRRRSSTPPPCTRAATAAVRPRCHRRRAPSRSPCAAPHPRPRPRRQTRRPRAPPYSKRRPLNLAQRRRAPRHPRAQSRSFHTSSSPRSRATFAFSRRSHHRFAHANCSRVCPRRFSHRSRATFLPSPVEMGREKRKGKEVVVEKPARKRTREEEAERAEMVAKAAEEQASGRARPFQIREDPRGRGRGRV